MPRPLLATLLWTAVICWATGIMWLSSMTPGQLPDAAFFTPDKLNHFVAFALGAWLTAAALRISHVGGQITRQVILAILLISAFGAFDEMLQTYTPGRQGGDVYDWIADFLGAIAGALLTLVTHARLERFVTRP